MLSRLVLERKGDGVLQVDEKIMAARRERPDGRSRGNG
jgi:hypothetical protein